MKIWGSLEFCRLGQAEQSKKHGGFVSGIIMGVTLGNVWTMIRRIKQTGEHSSVVQHVRQNGTILTSLDEISEQLARSFARISSLPSCLSGFLAIKECQEHELLDFSYDGSEHYNSLAFSMGELRFSLETSYDAAVGPDGIHFQFLKDLPRFGLRLLL